MIYFTTYAKNIYLKTLQWLISIMDVENIYPSEYQSFHFQMSILKLEIFLQVMQFIKKNGWRVFDHFSMNLSLFERDNFYFDKKNRNFFPQIERNIFSL